MIEKRTFGSLGHADHGWLDAHHHFSFADYYEPGRMGWGSIRVWNDDTIAPNSGFPPHPHRDMEIITYIREGAITHRDSMGNLGRTEAGDVQVMSAGSGVTHSEYNLEKENTRLFQIWIQPSERGGTPNWGAKPFPKGDRAGKFVALASGFDDDGDALPIRTPARVLGATIEAGKSIEHDLEGEHHAYLVPAKGSIEVNGERFETGDGAAITGETRIVINALEDSEIVLVDAA
jgi:redox-sensitive bicupin YhaK (pirin superfamily)